MNVSVLTFPGHREVFEDLGRRHSWSSSFERQRHRTGLTHFDLRCRTPSSWTSAWCAARWSGTTTSKCRSLQPKIPSSSRCVFVQRLVMLLFVLTELIFPFSAPLAGGGRRADADLVPPAAASRPGPRLVAQAQERAGQHHDQRDAAPKLATPATPCLN